MDKLYTFLHLTFQEFLSAYYIASLSPLKQMELLKINTDISLKQTLSATTAMFLCGLVNCVGDHSFLKVVIGLFEYRICSDLFSMAFESQQQAVCDIVLKLTNGVCNIFSEFHLSNLEYVASTTSKLFTEIHIFGNCFVEILQIIHKKHFANLLTMVINVDILESAQFAVVCDTLKHCTNLKNLELRFSGASIECVADVFHRLTSVREFSLRCSHSSEGIISLLSGLLNISGLQMKLTFKGLGEGVVREISEGLQLLSSNFNSDDAVALTETCRLKQLTSIEVSNNTISSLGASVVASAIQALSNLIYLEMSHSCLEDKGATIVAAAMKFMPSLERLLLNDNRFGPEGAIALGNEIQHLTELIHFDISHNNVGASGARAIASGIAHCTKITLLFMSDTNIDLDSATQIILSLKNSLIHFGEFSSPKRILKRVTFSVGDLILPGDKGGLASLKAAAQHPTYERTIDLGFDTITINPQCKK